MNMVLRVNIEDTRVITDAAARMKAIYKRKYAEAVFPCEEYKYLERIETAKKIFNDFAGIESTLSDDLSDTVGAELTDAEVEILKRGVTRKRNDYKAEYVAADDQNEEGWLAKIVICDAMIDAFGEHDREMAEAETAPEDRMMQDSGPEEK